MGQLVCVSERCRAPSLARLRLADAATLPRLSITASLLCSSLCDPASRRPRSLSSHLAENVRIFFFYLHIFHSQVVVLAAGKTSPNIKALLLLMVLFCLFHITVNRQLT